MGGVTGMWQDLRFGARTLRRSPGFTALAVLTLALGIGATTGIFTVVNGVLLRPLALSSPDELVRIYPRDLERGVERGAFSVPDFEDEGEQLKWLMRENLPGFFPYTAGENGGGAFIVLYLFCVVLVGLPLLMAEYAVGRKSGRSAIEGVETLRAAVADYTPDYVEARTGVPAEQMQAAARIFASARRGPALSCTGVNMAPRPDVTQHFVVALTSLCGRFNRAGDRIHNPGVLHPPRTQRAGSIAIMNSPPQGAPVPVSRALASKLNTSPTNAPANSSTISAMAAPL